ncbi:unnamed protein product, partial [Sphacelaria rigidula]
MADWSTAERHSAVVGDTSSPTEMLEVKENVASLQGSVTDITEQLAELKTMMVSQLVRGTSSTGPGAAVDEEGEAGDGRHTVAGAGTGRVRSPLGVGIASGP